MSQNTYQVGNHWLTEEEYIGKVLIDYSLYLNSITSIPDGFNPVVRGLLLNSVKHMLENFIPKQAYNHLIKREHPTSMSNSLRPFGPARDFGFAAFPYKDV